MTKGITRWWSVTFQAGIFLVSVVDFTFLAVCRVFAVSGGWLSWSFYFAVEISKFTTSHFQPDERKDFLCNYFLEIITTLVTFYSPSECQRYVSRLSCSPFLEISLSTSISLFHSFSLVLEKYFTRHISSRSFSTQEVKYPYKEHLCITFTALSLVWVLSMAEIRRFHNIPLDIAWFSCSFCRNLVILIRNRI